MILATPTATITTDTDKTSVTATIINETTDLPRTLANDIAIEKKLLYTHVQLMLRPHSKATVCGPPHAPTCPVLCPCCLRAVFHFVVAAVIVADLT
uniref:Uncharacterized protein n=1 Tax=Romanomermis culicivorax TaxID=13658 RepID=A0A915L0G4_ROMCU